MPTGIPKNGINKGWFKKGTKHPPITPKGIEKLVKFNKERMNKLWANPDFRKRMSEAHKGNKGYWTGKKRILTEEWKKKIGIGNTGEKNGRWISDRTKLVKKQKRNDSAYYAWAMSVKRRDNWKCKIHNKDCKGKVIAHHILPWREYEELRYNINNGITLCQAHHPRRRAEEKRLIPTFQELVSVLEVKN